ncbi:MAG: hypothetical protein PHT19_14935 [Methylococcus sp.]|nr:hypothetical protein [Methylococcus sp.]
MNKTSTSPLTLYGSPVSVKETIDRIENILPEKGVAVFARIDHGSGTKVAYQNMENLVEEYGIQRHQAIIENMTATLKAIVTGAISSQ